jgi:hypothetical protein
MVNKVKGAGPAKADFSIMMESTPKKAIAALCVLCAMGIKAIG